MKFIEHILSKKKIVGAIHETPLKMEEYIFSFFLIDGEKKKKYYRFKQNQKKLPFFFFLRQMNFKKKIDHG